MSSSNVVTFPVTLSHLGSFLEIISETSDSVHPMSPSLNDLITSIGQLDDEPATSPPPFPSSANDSYSSAGSSRLRTKSQVSSSGSIASSSLSTKKTLPKRRKSLAKVFAKSKSKKNGL